MESAANRVREPRPNALIFGPTCKTHTRVTSGWQRRRCPRAFRCQHRGAIEAVKGEGWLSRPHGLAIWIARRCWLDEDEVILDAHRLVLPTGNASHSLGDVCTFPLGFLKI
jgi:hypothetical protein